MRSLPCISEVCNGARKVCKLCENLDICIIGVVRFSQNECSFRGDTQASVKKRDKGWGSKKIINK